MVTPDKPLRRGAPGRLGALAAALAGVRPSTDTEAAGDDAPVMGTGRYVRLLSALYASTFLIRTSFGITTVTLGKHVESSNLGYGLIVSSSPLFELITVLFLGVIIDRHGRKETLLAGLALGAISLFGLAVSPNPWWLWSVNALHGVAAAAILITTLALIADYAPHGDRGREMGAYDFMNLFGWVAGFSIGFVLLGAFPDHLEYTFIIAGAMATMGLIYAWFAIIEPGRHKHTVEDADWRHILHVVRQRDVFLLTAPWFIVFVLISSVLTFLSRTTVGALELNEFHTALGLLGLGLVFLASQVIFGKMSDKHGREPLMFAGALGFVGLMSTIAWGFLTAPDASARVVFDHVITSHWQLLGAFLLAGLAFGPAALAALADFAQEHPKGITMSVYSVVIAAGMIVGPPTVGWLTDTWGGMGVVVFFLALSVTMLALVTYRYLDNHPHGHRVRHRARRALRPGR